MQLRYLDVSPAAGHDTPLLAVAVTTETDRTAPWFTALDAACSGRLSAAFDAGDMRGKGGDQVLMYMDGGDGPRRVVLLGIGAAAEVDAEGIRRFAGRAVRAAEKLRLEQVSILLDGLGAVGAEVAAQAAAEGAGLAAWRYSEQQAVDEDDPRVDVRQIDLLGSNGEDAARGAVAGAAIARAANFARTLQTRPGNVATPTHIADEASRMAGSVGLHAQIFDEERMLEEGMHALLSVSRGSEEEARFIILEHRGGADGEAPLVLVGKGLSFDAGGISLKPPAGMEEMKYDMSGGAAVIGAMQAIAELGIKANVVGIVPSSENLPSGTATKPGDVIDSLAGKTIEVINTDAEGRLILADALAWGARMKPAAMVDCATLTGSVIIALGHHASAVMGNNDGVVEELKAAGERSGERCWPLPLWKEYTKQLESPAADLKNVGGRPGGSITAGAFLKEFVGDTPWAHLDVAGTAWGEGSLSYQRKGALGTPTRLLIEWVRGRTG